MDRWEIDLLFMAACFLLPLVPSLLLYYAKWKPANEGEASGTLFGLSFKFSASAGLYVVLLVVAMQLRPRDTDHYHTWLVEGQVEAPPQAGQPDANLNDLFVRIVPPRLAVMNGGRFSWEIPVIEDSVGRLHFPNIQLDLAGYRGVTVPLSPDRSYGGAQVEMTHDDARRLIVFAKPLVLESSRSGRAYAGINVVPAPPAVGAPVISAPSVSSPAAVGERP